MEAREAFKFGFMLRCVEAGVTDPGAIYKQAVEKQALLGLGTLPGKALDAVSGLGRTAAMVGVPLALAAPPVAGALMGHGLATATETDDRDVDEAKREELIGELRRQTARLQQMRQAGRRNKR